MAAPSVPAEDPSGEGLGLSGGVGPFAPLSVQGNDGKSGRLLLSDVERTREALLASAIAVEFIRVMALSDSAAPSDSRVAARYVSQVVDNSRVLYGGNPRLHLNLLVSHRDWMRSLPTGSGELR